MSNNSEIVMTMSSETKAMFLAAQARIEAVPAGKTLIDSIPDADWLSESVANWNINSGSDSTGSSEELDDSDKLTVNVA